MTNQYRGVHEEKTCMLHDLVEGWKLLDWRHVDLSASTICQQFRHAHGRHIYLEVHRLSFMRRWCIVAMAMVN